jgi:predicted regulator of amino acid metabolism with ACT domain
MLKLIAHRVLGFSAQERISKAMLSNGINLRPDGCYYCGPVVLADVAFAAAIGVDRRSLRRFAKKVLRSPELRSVYCNIEKTVSPVLLKSEENGLVRLWAFAK